MNDLETKLQKLPVETAPDTLDRRVEETLQAYNTARYGTFSVRIPLWACAAACVAFFAVGMLLSPRDAPMPAAHNPPAPIKYTIEASPAFAAVFAGQAAPDNLFLRKKLQINPIQLIETKP